MSDHISRSTPDNVRSLNDLQIVGEHEELLRENGLDSLVALLARPPKDETLHKPGLAPWRERLRLTLSSEGRRRTFYLKRFRNPPRSSRREVRRSGTGANSVAGMEWAWAQSLAADGIRCLRPIAMGERIQNRIELCSAILSEAVPGKSLEQWAGEWNHSDRPTIHGLLEPLADLVGRFHACGYVHRDLYLSHIFFDPALPLDQSLSLIDLQRVVRTSRQRTRWIIKDLAALNYSTPLHLVGKSARLRWLTHYLGVSKLDRSVESLVYPILGKTQRMARHDERRRLRLKVHPLRSGRESRGAGE